MTTSNWFLQEIRNQRFHLTGFRHTAIPATTITLHNSMIVVAVVAVALAATSVTTAAAVATAAAVITVDVVVPEAGETSCLFFNQRNMYTEVTYVLTPPTPPGEAATQLLSPPTTSGVVSENKKNKIKHGQVFVLASVSLCVYTSVHVLQYVRHIVSAVYVTDVTVT